MAKLTTKTRAKIPASEFAGPGRSFPIEDANHARAALSMMHNAPESEQASIRAKAEAKLHHGARADHTGYHKPK
jgi:hypothetical protein